MSSSDPTIIPPPCLDVHTARDLYLQPFKRVTDYIELCNVPGDVCEFGTFNGYTARLLAEYLFMRKSKKTLWLYDSWQGFPKLKGNDAECPEAQTGAWKQGDCQPVSTDMDLVIESRLRQLIPVKTVKGFYEETLADDKSLPASIALLHIDCDLYESAATVLSKVKNRLSKGAVILFDDFNNNKALNEFGERKAFKEFLADTCEPWFTYGWSGYVFLANS